MKHSIRRQMALIFIGMMLLVLLANWLINNFFLEDYYLMKKEKDLVQVYTEVNEVGKDSDYASNEFIETLHSKCMNYNISAAIIEGTDFTTIYQSNSSREMVTMIGNFFGYMMGIDDSERTIQTEKENYVVQRNTDTRSSTENLEMLGVLESGDFLIMRIPLQSIRENVKISNEFLAYICIAGLLFSIIIIWWLSNKITQPILELTDLSKRMAGLDFEARYTSGGQDEIGQLGDHFNQMSKTLEQTISQLKSVNNELQKDIEKKIQVDEMRKEFLSNVSHELKTPIALIQGYAEGLKECINDDEENRDFYCEVIMDESAKMNQMVKKLLSLNQLEFGQDKILMERFEMNSLMSGVVQSASILAQQKNAKIIFEEKEPMYVWADEFKIEEVVTNYISNAINHVSGSKIIEIKMQALENKVRVSVFNTGLPIPEEELGNIWIKFYKVDKARTREYGGSGIGLSIVKAIMDSFREKCGAINYDNGVEFWFELDAGQTQRGENE